MKDEHLKHRAIQTQVDRPISNRKKSTNFFAKIRHDPTIQNHIGSKVMIVFNLYSPAAISKWSLYQKQDYILQGFLF